LEVLDQLFGIFGCEAFTVEFVINLLNLLKFTAKLDAIEIETTVLSFEIKLIEEHLIKNFALPICHEN
jgi:hypothetical protein